MGQKPTFVVSFINVRSMGSKVKVIEYKYTFHLWILFINLEDSELEIRTGHHHCFSLQKLRVFLFSFPV